jgi:GNAT superfamily N-acetyltransferase
MDDVDLSLHQFIEAWRLMCAHGPDPSTTAGEGAIHVFSGLPIAFFNVTVLTGHDLSAETLLVCGADARGWASDRDVPWLLIVTHEALQPGVDATAVLDQCGLGPMMPLTGMRAERIVAGARTPEGLQLTVPRDDDGCSAILDVNALAYAMDLDAGKVGLGTAAFWKDHFPVLGSVGGTPACSAGVMMIDGYRYVALVATDPAHQRRGYAEAAMRHALEAAAQARGETPTVLHATEAGRPIYERMGYAPISRHTVFMEKQYLHGA